VHREVYRIIGSNDPYRELKVRADEVASKLMPEARALVEGSPDPLETAVLCSIAGNVMDFGTGKGVDDPDELVPIFRSIVEQGLDVNDLHKVRDILQEAGKVLYLFDNCGEAVFDRLVIEQLQAYGVRVVGVVKGEPVLTDVTREDAERIGLDAVLDGILDTGGFAVGMDLELLDERTRNGMECADLVLAKGMANFEALSDSSITPIAYVMKAKCWPVARGVGARKGDNVVSLHR
jgi:uncharacterized protein with ATP-grasp and redox domains